MPKLKSRKLWGAVGAVAVIIILIQVLGGDNPATASLIDPLTKVIMTYLGAQGIADAAGAIRKDAT